MKASCRQCGSELQEQSKFCPSCGSEVVSEEEMPSQTSDAGDGEGVGMLTCRKCGDDMPEEALFCPGCGASTAAETGEVPLSSPPMSASRSYGEISSGDRNMAMLCHLISFVGIVLPFGNILGPLVVWLTQREKSSFVDEHGKESINFQLSLIVYSFVGVVVLIVSAILVIVFIGIFMLIIVALVALAFFVFSFVVVILAAIRASNGEMYRYPLSIRFLK